MLHFDISALERSLRIEEIRWANLPYKRPRSAGCNARLGVHGWGGELPIGVVRIGGVEGFGWCTMTRQQAEKMVGLPLRALFLEDGMLREEYYGLEFPLLDWLGKALHQPVYRLVAKHPERLPKSGYSVPVYDTTIYFDELQIVDNKEAVAFICDEVRQGLERGHRHFKVKIGRCGMWMDLEQGLKRDVEIILAIRQLIGPDARLMVDANNGYNLNLTKQFLIRTASAKIHWLEEAFHEDDQLYANLRDWMKHNQIDTLIADGEGYASSAIEDWAKKGLIDILQYDLRGYGFFRWLKLGEELDRFGIQSAPHNYGGYYGNFAQAHFAAAIDGFAFAEFDVADAQGVDSSAYKIEEGRLIVPELDGFGLKLDSTIFGESCTTNGWKV